MEGSVMESSVSVLRGEEVDQDIHAMCEMKCRVNKVKVTVSSKEAAEMTRLDHYMSIKCTSMKERSVLVCDLTK
jgi:hypothetical protein